MFLIAFDLDGTLIDSAAGIHASLVAACAALDVPPPSLEQLQRHIGPLKPAPLAAQVLERSGIGTLVRSLQAPQPGGRIHKAACLEQLRRLAIASWPPAMAMAAILTPLTGSRVLWSCCSSP